MKKTVENVCGLDLKCPECHRPLKPFRIRRDNGKDVVCGGCGREFTCDEVTNLEGAPAKGR